MATVVGQATDPASPGVFGTPMNIDVPGIDAVGVRGDGGSGFPSPTPFPPLGRRAIGVEGISADPAGVGVLGQNNAAGVGVQGSSNGGGIGVLGLGSAGGVAGKFLGDLLVTGNASVGGTLSVTTDIVLASADCAEDFDVVDDSSCEPGSVMVLGDDGLLQAASQGYDKRVAGVVSGAGAYKPGIILDKVISSQKRMPIALLGKVYCKVDARYAPVGLGDLLTTSCTPGHAMKAVDSSKAFGAVIGKALRPLEAGQGLIPILVALQ
jgi:hypothetical protein